MATIGTIAVNVEVCIKNFDKRLKKSRAEIKRLQERVKLYNRAFKTGSVAAVAALATVAVAVKRVVNVVAEGTARIDLLAKTSRKLGTGTAELQALRHAAKLSGVELKALDTGAQRFTRRLSETAAGGKSLAGVFRELNIDAKELSRLPLIDQLGVVADRMKLLKSQADRVRVSFKLFDTEGVALVNTLAGGSAGLKKAAADFHNLGGSITDRDAAKAERLANAIERLSVAKQGVGDRLTIQIAPAAAETLEGFTLALQRFNGVRGRATGVATAAGAVGRTALGLTGPGRGFLGARRGIGAAADRFFRGTTPGLPGVDIAARKRAAADRRAEIGDQLPGDISKARGVARRGLDRAGDGIRNFAKAFTAAGRRVRGAVTRTVFAQQIRDSEAVKEFASGLEERLRTPQERLGRELGTIEKARARGLITDSLAGRARADASQRFTPESRGPIKSPSLLEVGTAEAFAALRKNLNQSREKDILNVNKQQLDEQKEQSKHLETIAETLGEYKVVGGPL